MKISIIVILFVFSIILIPSVSAITFPQLESNMIKFSTDKKSYYLGENVIIIGTSKNHQEEYLNFIIFTNGERSIETTVKTNEDGSFTKTIPPHNFNNATKNWIVQVHHLHDKIDYEHRVQTDFNYGLSDIVTISNNEYVEKIEFSTNKKSYNAEDTITLTGKAPKEHVWNNFLVDVFDPEGEKIVSKTAKIDHNGYFSIEILTDNFVKNGEYVITLPQKQYDNDSKKVSFQYNDPQIIDIVALDKQVQTIDSDVTELRTDVNSIQLQLDNLQKFIDEQFKIIFSIFNSNNEE